MDRWDRKTGFCCRTCASYAPKDEGMGRCRRHAPTMQGYPAVYAENDWCGDHKIGSNPSKAAFEKKRDKEVIEELKNLRDEMMGEARAKNTEEVNRWRAGVKEARQKGEQPITGAAADIEKLRYQMSDEYREIKALTEQYPGSHAAHLRADAWEELKRRNAKQQACQNHDIYSRAKEAEVMCDFKDEPIRMDEKPKPPLYSSVESICQALPANGSILRDVQGFSDGRFKLAIINKTPYKMAFNTLVRPESSHVCATMEIAIMAVEPIHPFPFTDAFQTSAIKLSQTQMGQDSQEGADGRCEVDYGDVKGDVKAYPNKVTDGTWNWQHSGAEKDPS